MNKIPGCYPKSKEIVQTKTSKDELEEAVVNLLLSGTAVNDFLENDARNEVDDEEEAIRTLPASTWKRWLGVNYWRTLNLFRNNPFYGNKAKGRKVSLENFNPANFARTIVKERKTLLANKTSSWKLIHDTIMCFMLLGLIIHFVGCVKNG